MQPLITFLVPCYNSEDYMEKCINSILVGRKFANIEIIIVDDGSTDNTGKIADRYEKNYPDICRVIHQKNQGHGEGLNQGIRYGRGLYYKVVDSDDWIDEKAYRKTVQHLKRAEMQGGVDVFITNFVYEHIGNGTFNMHFRGILPQNRIFTWKETRPFFLTKHFMMHNCLFNMKLIHKMNVKLPKHIFYEDSYFTDIMISGTNRLYYVDEDFYRYLIGREGQSVNEEIMIKRAHHQYKLTWSLVNRLPIRKLMTKNPKLARYLVHELGYMLAETAVFMRLRRNKKSEYKMKQMWEHVMEKDSKIGKRLRYCSLATFIMFPGTVGREISIWIYRQTQKVMKFN